MQNKTVLITGANSGIGLETARALAANGGTVLMACRDLQRGEAALADINQSVSHAKLELLQLDLADLASVAKLAKLIGSTRAIDVLINNAGVCPATKHISAQGFELQYAVNHLGHFLLTNLLLPNLQAAPKARVISVASMLHRFGNIDFGSLRGEKLYFTLQAYAQSKLANVLFIKELARLNQNNNISAFALHPGEVATNIGGRGWLRRKFYGTLARTKPIDGARTSIYLASEPDIESESGGYFDKYASLQDCSKRGADSALAAKLWQVSLQQCAAFMD